MLLKYFTKFGDKDISVGLARSYYQLLILDEIYNSKFRNSVVLRGLLCGKLAYGVGDGSGKIELASLKKPYTQEFLAFVKKVTRKFPHIKIVKTSDKRYTFNIELEIHDDEIIKTSLEISKIKYNWKRGINYDLKIFKSDKWNFNILGLGVQMSELVNKYKELSTNNNS